MIELPPFEEDMNSISIFHSTTNEDKVSLTTNEVDDISLSHEIQATTFHKNNNEDDILLEEYQPSNPISNNKDTLIAQESIHIHVDTHETVATTDGSSTPDTPNTTHTESTHTLHNTSDIATTPVYAEKNSHPSINERLQEIKTNITRLNKKINTYVHHRFPL